MHIIILFICLGPRCETKISTECEDGYFKLPGKYECGPCNCDVGRSFDPACNKTSGACYCKVCILGAVFPCISTPLNMYVLVLPLQGQTLLCLVQRSAGYEFFLFSDPQLIIIILYSYLICLGWVALQQKLFFKEPSNKN